jgi:hypothetical protein
MLSRAGSDASTHLRRTKSAISVKKRRREPLTHERAHPETARIHALTAAHIAIGRANERASIEMRRSAELARCNGNDGKSGNLAKSRSQTLNFSPASELQRQRSILQSKGPSIAASSHKLGTIPYEDLSHYTAPPPSELGALDKYGSEPSSYRKLRKAKSVLTPRKRTMSMHNLSSCSPSSTRTLQHVKSSLGDAEQGLKLGIKRSMSFLRGSSSNLSKAFKRVESQVKQHDEAIQLAQQQFLNDLEQQRLCKKTSFFFSTKTRHQQKPLRKTVRSSRTTEFGDGVRSENQAANSFKPESKSRSISASIRDKMKWVFGRSVSNKDKFPAQQLDASRPYFRENVVGSGMESALDQYFVGDNDATSRGSLYIPSNRECDSLEDLDRMSATLKSAQSMESLHSNSRSRVTSWTNSTTTNSFAARSTPLDRKRLSIIKEDGGPHQPSSSIGRHVGGIEVFRKPLPSQNGYGEPAPAVDSHRIYSALVKRIDQEQADAESSQDADTPFDGGACTLPNSAQSYQTVPTIRAVPSEASIRTIAPDSEHRQFSISSAAWHKYSGMTPQDLAQHNENVERRRARLAEQEQQSSFFPFSSQSKSQTPSPFKLALTARKESPGESHSESGSTIVNRPTDSDDQVQGKFAVSSDSIYSRTTGGHPNPQNLSGHTSPQNTDESPPLAGMATIISAKVARYPRPTPSLVQLHRARSSERGESKGWMENQMTNLDRHHSRTSTSHHREHAQIDGDDTAVASGDGRLTASTSFRPDIRRGGSHRTVENAKDNIKTPVLLQRNSSIMNERFPLLDLKEVPRNSTPKPTDGGQKRASMVGMNDENSKLGGVDIQKRASVPLRGRRSQVLLKYKDQYEDSPPVSTSPRLQVPSQESCNAASFADWKELTPTPKQRPKSQMSLANWAQFGRNITNESDRNLSRLSRPFDMDIPDGNRPFDSEYLGIEQSYGIGDTALPKIEERSAHNENRKMISSKRMVSNFLRSRRKNGSAQDRADSAMRGGSPAFV